MKKQFNNVKNLFTLIVIGLFLAVSIMGGIAAAQTTDRNDTDNRIDIGEPLILPNPDDNNTILPPDPADYVTVSGVVKDIEGHPVPKIWVNADSDIRFLVDCYNEDCMKPYYGSGETNENGEFSLEVPGGFTYDLFVDTHGFTEAGLIGGYFQDADGGTGSDPGADKQWQGSTTNDWEKRTIIDVGADGISGIAITVNPATQIYGKVLDAEGNPVRDMWIEAQAYYEDVSSDRPAGWTGGSTDENGNFKMMTFPGATYRISAWPWKEGFIGGYWKETEDSDLTASGRDGTLIPSWDDVTLIDASEDVEINIILKKGNTISGSVTDEAGDPVAGIWVEAYTESAEECVPPPDMGIPEQEIPDEKCVPVPAWFGGSTDENGNYEISVYPASDYRVGVPGNGMYKTVYYNNTPNWEDAALIDTSSASVTGINFTLKMGAGISGIISGLAKDDVVTIEIWSFSRGNWRSTRVVGTGEDVSFKIRGLEDGDDYVINVWAEGYLSGCLQKDGTFGNCYEGTCFDAAGIPCTDDVESNETALFKAGATDVNIKMDKGKTISGTLTGLTAGDMTWVTAYSDNVWSKGGTQVIAEGNTAEFTISGLAIGADFRVMVDAKGYVSGYYGGSDASGPVSWDKAVLISTKDGDVSGIKIAMSTGNTISGTVKGLDEGMKAWINAWSESSGSRADAVIIGTGADVTYEIKCLNPASDFRVFIQSEGYIGGYYSEAGTTDWENADLVDSSVNPKNIDFTLSKGNTISGTITGLKRGDWATVEAYREREAWIDDPIEPGIIFDENGGKWGGNSWGMISVVGTGEPVSYTITGLAPADDFVVVFRSYGYAPQIVNDVDTSLNPENIDFVAAEGRRISGKISGAGANQWVWINAQSESSWDSGYAEAQTDENGNAVYEIKGLGNATDYVVSVWSEKYHLFYNQQLAWDKAAKVDLSAGSATNIDFDFDAIEKYVLSGTIAGVAEDTQVWINAWSETIGAWGNANVTGNGKFSIELPAGDYKLSIYADGYVGAYYDAESGKLTHDWDAAKPVSLTENKNLGVLTLSAGYAVYGTVTNAQGDTVVDAWIDIFGDKSGNGSGVSRKGTYRVGGLVDGTYTINVWSSEGFYTETVTISGSDVEHNIILEENQNVGNVWDKAPSFADDEDLRDSATLVLVLFDSNGKFVDAVETDDAGNYSFGDLEPGEYTVKIEKEDGTLEELETFTVED